MATSRQVLGAQGETAVVQNCGCPKCKRDKTLRRLPVNFKCADVICDFCGYLAQVKAVTVHSIEVIPSFVLGAAWGVQQARMQAGIYFPLFLVLVNGRNFSIFYLSADAQNPEMFVPRAPLSIKARRAGWQGFRYDLRKIRPALIRLL